MEQTIVYRVENHNHRGPYDGCGISFTRPACRFDWATRNHSTNKNTPPWIYDEGIRIPKCYERFGFETLKQAKQWFTAKELERLARLGFFLYEMSGKVIQRGKKQITFRPDEKIRKLVQL